MNYHAIVLDALEEMGTSSTREVMLKVKMPTVKVRRYLDDLEELGLVLRCRTLWRSK